MKYIISFAASFLAAAAILSLAPIHGEAEIYDNVLRLHVIAESDSDEDQALKLKVRDAVLTCLSDELADCTSFEEAYEAVDGMHDAIVSAAENCVLENVRHVRFRLGLEEKNIRHEITEMRLFRRASIIRSE